MTPASTYGMSRIARSAARRPGLTVCRQRASAVPSARVTTAVPTVKKSVVKTSVPNVGTRAEATSAKL